MEVLGPVSEWLGVLAFAASGAMVGIRHRLDLFGVLMLGMVTALGGGVIRDVILGQTPPWAFRHPQFAAAALCVSAVIFLPRIREGIGHSTLFDSLLQAADAVGLAAFTVSGIRTAVDAGFDGNTALLLFVGVITGVGGGILRDQLAGQRPMVFVKQIYAVASLAGALVCVGLMRLTDMRMAMLAGFVVVVTLRFSAMHYHWNLPRA